MTTRPQLEHERIRRNRGLSLSDLATRLGFSVSYASRVERRLAPANLAYQRAFARALRARREDVFDLDGWVKAGASHDA